jgi:hypothetical protein
MQSMLDNMKSASSTTELANSVSVFDEVIRLAEATKQVSPETV